jgi:energy-converting hydrogenase Eha subunit F
MISPIKNQDFGIPAPIVELTMEQQFKLKQIENALRHPESKKEDIITIFLALQRQCFVLGNSMSNLVKKWPTPIPQVQLLPTRQHPNVGLHPRPRTELPSW